MAKITATGAHAGYQLEVTVEMADGELLVDFDGDEDIFLEKEFRTELEKRHPVAGTFYPEVESLTNALEVLRFHFFDDEPIIQVDGDIGEEIPYEDDMIY